MANEYFQPGSVPAPNSPGSSAIMRQEFASIAAGFDKLPVLAGHSLEFVSVDATGTRLVASGLNGDDVVTLDGVQTLTNKTIAWSSNTFPGFDRFLTKDGVETVTNKTISWSANTFPGFGTGATKTAGTGADNVLLLTANNKLPALDGSLLTNLSQAAIGVVEIDHGGTGGTTLSEAQTNLGIDLKADANDAVLTGAPTAPTPPTGDNSARIATTYFVTNTIQDIGSFAPSNAAPKMDGVAASGIGALGSRDDHVHPTDTTRAPLASPAFTGAPTAPTAAAQTNTTQIATTAFVNAEIAADRPYSDTNPLINGTAAQGTSARVSRQDHVHPTDTTRAPLVSPAFTGTPTAPTPITQTNTTQIATTAFVQSLIAQQPAAGMQPSNTNPLMNGTVSPGTGVEGSRYDHVHPTDTSRFAVNGGNITGATSIGVATSTPALRITQEGTGNALLVEDSANPDSTPFAITADGTTLIGSTGSYGIGGVPLQLQVHKAEVGGISLVRWGGGTLTQPAYLIFGKGRGGAVGTYGAVVDGDDIGLLRFAADDGTDMGQQAADILVQVDGDIAANSIPGRIIFKTTAAGNAAPTERMRIDSRGNVGLGAASGTLARVIVGGVLTSSSGNSQSVRATPTVPSSSVTAYYGFVSGPTTQAATFNVGSLFHYTADNANLGAGSSITNQYGFYVPSTFGAATTINAGFYGNIPAGTGRWNFYAAGTAENYFGGPTTINVSSTSAALRVTQTGTGEAFRVEDSANPDATPFVVNTNGDAGVGGVPTTSGLSVFKGGNYSLMLRADNYVTLRTESYRESPSDHAQWVTVCARGTEAAPAVLQSGDRMVSIRASGWDETAFAGGSFEIIGAADGLHSATSQPGRITFATTLAGATVPAERMRIDNAGRVGIGHTTINAGSRVHAGPIITGDINAQIFRAEGNIQSDVTNVGRGYITSIGTAAAAFSTKITHFEANQGVIGSGSTVSTQIGFAAQASLVGAANNYGFYSNIPVGTSNYNFYAPAGSAQNFFGGTTVMQVSSASDALRITQTGAGNSLVVEDSANPDGSPFVIDGSGYVVVGKPTQASIGGSSAPLQVWSNAMASISVARLTAAANGPYFLLHKSRSATLTGNAIVQNGDDLGTIQWSGDDGVTQNTSAAFIRSSVDGVPAASDIPSRIIFSTKQLGVAGPTERMRITSTGAISIGAGGNADTALQINRGIFGAVNSYGVRYTGLVAASVTNSATIFSTVAATEPATTIQTLNHFVAGQGTFGAGSTVAEQRGFVAAGDMVGATNSTVGFLSDIPNTTTNGWNFYASGSAPSLFVAPVYLQSSPTASEHATRKDYVDSVAGSDARLKDDIAQLEGGLDMVKRLRGVTFTWNDKLPDPGRVGKESVGVIAQEVALVVPRAIYGDVDMLGIETNALSGVFIEAIKELSAKLDTALDRVAELEAKVVA